jgi:hypothetical protein
MMSKSNIAGFHISISSYNIPCALTREAVFEDTVQALVDADSEAPKRK